MASTVEDFSNLDSVAGVRTTTEKDDIDRYMTTAQIYQYTYLAVGGVGVLSNLLVIVVILISSSMRGSFTNKFIVNQSLIDFSTSLAIITTGTLQHPEPPALGNGIAQDIYCVLWLTKWPLWGMFVSSTWNLVALTLERYLAILYPLQHSHRFTKTKAYIVMVSVWIIGLGFRLIINSATTKRENNLCKAFRYPNIVLQRFVGVFSVCFQYFIPLIIITFAYIGIFITLRKSSQVSKDANVGNYREDRMKRARKNTIKTLFKVFACFVCCWTPNQIFYTAYNFGYEFTDDANLYHSTILLLFVNSCINPFVYILTYGQFQEALVKLFCPNFIPRRRNDNDSHSIASNELKSAQTLSTMSYSGSVQNVEKAP